MNTEPPEEVLERLWRAHVGDLNRLAYLMVGDREEAEQTVQDAFVLAWERWDRVSTYDAPEAWIRATVVNKALSWRRRLRLAASKRHLIGEKQSNNEPAAHILDSDLLMALNGLSASQRAVIVLRYVEDLSIEQVADLTGRKAGTVRALTSQGLRRLREQLTKEDGAWASRTKS